MSQRIEESYKEIQSDPSESGQRTTMEESNRKRLCLIGGAVATLLIVAIFVLILVFTLHVGGDKCKLTDTEPKQELTHLPSIRSADNRALVRFAGFLRLAIVDNNDDYEFKYLPLTLKTVHYSVFANQNILLSLEADCAKLDMKIRETTEHEYQVLSLSIMPKIQSARFDRCGISTTALNTRSDEHYKCLYDKSYECTFVSDAITANNRTLAVNSSGSLTEVYLIANQLEFELDGDTKLIAQGEFSKTAKECRSVSSSS